MTLPEDAARAAEDPQRRFGPDGRYVLLQELGSGGMGIVWKAWDTRLGRPVAIKGLQATTPEFFLRFSREARVLARLNHPGIVRMFDLVEQGSDRSIVMEFVEGTPLDSARLELKEKARVLRDAAAAVHYAHENGVLHRDLKPSNLMLDSQGRVRVMDFGLAREARGDAQTQQVLTASGEIFGTPSFMAPEQALGQHDALDARADVYGLGATFYYLLTGRLPHEGATTFETLKRVVETEPAPPRVHPELDKVCLKAMEKDPARRYPTAAALADDLDRFLRGEPVAASPPSWSYRVRRRISRNPWAWTGMAAAALGVAGVAVLAVVLLRDLADRRRYEEATHEWERVEAQHYGDALAAMRAGRRDEAEEHLRALVEGARRVQGIHPRCVAGWAKIARPARLLGRDAEAADAVDRVLAADGHYGLAWIERAMLKIDEYRRLRVRARADLLAERSAMRVRGEIESIREPTPAELEESEPGLARLRAETMECLDRGAAAEGMEPAQGRAARAWLAYLQGRRDEAARIASDARVEEAFLLLGQLEEDAGRWGEAEARYTELIEYDAGYAAAFIARARARSSRGEGALHTDPAAARAALEAAVADWDRAVAQIDDAATRLGRSRSWRILGDAIQIVGEDPTDAFDHATADATEVLQHDATDAEAHVLLGAAHCSLAAWLAGTGGRAEECFRAAVDCFRRAIENDPENADAYSNLGAAWLRWGYWNEAQGMDPVECYRSAAEGFREALARYPRSTGAMNNLGTATMLEGEWRMGRGGDPTERFEAARRAYEGTLQISPGDAAALTNLGDLLTQQGKWEARNGRDPTDRFAAALEAVQQGADREPASSSVWLTLGNVHIARGEWELEAGAESAADSFRAASAAYRNSIERNPRSSEALANLAGAQLYLGRWMADRGQDPVAAYDEGLDACRRSLEANPEHPSTWVAIGALRLKKGEWISHRGDDAEGEFREAIRALDHAREIAHESRDSLKNLGGGRLRLAEYLDLRGRDPEADYAGAIDSYARALDLYGESPDLLIEHAYARAERASWRSRRGADPTGEFQAAEAECSRALEIQPGCTGAYHNRGLVHDYRGDWLAASGADPMGEYEAAAREYREAAARNPSDPMARAGLAQVCFKAGEALRGRGEDPTTWYDEAIRACREEVDRTGGDGPTWYNLGGVWERVAEWRQSTGEDPEPAYREATHALGEATSRAPGNAQNAVTLAGTLVIWGMWRDATGTDSTEVYLRCIETCHAAEGIHDDEPMVHGYHAYACANLYLRRRDTGGETEDLVAEAIREYGRALELDSANVEVRVNFGRLYGNLGRWREALEQYEEARRIAGDSNSELPSLIEEARRQLGEPEF